MEQLLEILKHKRPYDSAGERAFLGKFIAGIPGIKFDTELNFWVRIGETKTAFSCHTDTVHSKDGTQVYYQFEDMGMVAKATESSDESYDGDCLGADDGVGIWIMLQMIEAKVPGLYLFHRGEELGGIGSSYIAEHNPGLLQGIQRVIAFDRRGDSDIITHQAGGRCCSDEFAWELSSMLRDVDTELDLVPSNRGMFTDTANYTELVPECTNISVGYEMEHSVYETLDIAYAERLLSACVAIDWESLPTVRECGEVVPTGPANRVRASGRPDRWENVEMNYNDCLEAVMASPEVAAELLIEWGVTYEDFRIAYEDLYGVNRDGTYRYDY